MKKVLGIVFAFSMILSVAFIAGNNSSSPFSASAQQVSVTKKRRPGIIRSTARGGKWVVRKTWDGTKWVSRKVWVGTKWTGKTTWKTGRKVVSRSRKIIY